MPQVPADMFATLQRDSNEAIALKVAIEKAIAPDAIRALVRDALIRAARHRSAEVAVEYVTEAMIFHLATLGSFNASAPKQPAGQPDQAEARA